ncbi:BAG family molecular chaperone regulator 1-like [Dioscorea cayenensis subsp. rotundata]|uniref:BAG family molecular chaperone regulator 1-like n=1 Tax=Dioscorea cayennensis subsp. rotundata TaxID=55577 RepID=A0AB40C630_DIOCR|nr:BAG family molecular chaperone regulator 1-like [Dioscorea cayenensis subsp. rotundata]
MMKFKTKTKLFMRSSSSSSNSKLSGGGCGGGNSGEEIEWELRPGGMLVQKRESGKGGAEIIRVRVRVSMASLSHDISISATSTFGELKMVLSMVTGLEARAQRILFKGKEREDGDHLHMVGVKDNDKVLLLEDPCLQRKKEPFKFHRKNKPSHGKPLSFSCH